MPRSVRPLSAAQARKLADVETEAVQLGDEVAAATKAALEQAGVPALQDRLQAAIDKRDELRGRYRARCPANIPLRAGGIRVLRMLTKGRRSFSIAGYLDEGNPLTPAMRAHYNPGTPGERWEVGPA